ncbi:NAD dependent epimerase/dehydratase family protein [Dothidotthia symphoricarpi CBS 119687]|uniref:NAD dependent epimerase/dehydratase family protein n=1 Tax=Dothidotthia symphoricarpi CBS 119687 TaxID=1392245 RepID=A0A6A6AF51_9PLEO|nr:NAD dependent epimerase/dehydratase family protein [Dothidotthia symphoricarpi CBS 119687]KAF2129745.1 NAD dependent epimerase/dehydratase family protein [Dothidotthia symphoricarpi CBS 119687]
MPSAIVTGATGILGREIVAELSKHRQQWPTVHALSRSKKEECPDNVIHHHIDLQSSADEMAEDLKNVKGEYVFFAAYLAQDTEQGAWDVNGAMLSNFLQALVKTGAINDIKRIVLITGAKQYGVHLGVPKQPMMESDQWLWDDKWPPNFYYNQQTILHKFCSEHNKEWVVTYPNDVIGFATGNFMNLSLALALYMQVSKELDGADKGVVFPGSPAFYTMFDCFTSSKLHAEFCAWAALEPRTANQAFNVVNGDVESWQNMWPRVAEYFGTKVKPDQFADVYKSSPVASISKWIAGEASSSTNLDPEPPLTAMAERSGLQGSPALAQSKVEANIDLVKWSERADVNEAWKKIAKREGLDEEIFEKATWSFLGFVLGRAFDLVITMSKAREYGWTGYRDTYGALEEAFGEMKERKIIAKA